MSRFYLTNHTFLDKPFSVSSLWSAGHTSGADTKNMYPYTWKRNSLFATKSCTGTSSVNSINVCNRQYVSDLILPQTLAGKISGQVRCAGAFAAGDGGNLDYRTALDVYVVDEQGTFVSRLYSGIMYSGQWSSSLTNRYAPFIRDITSCTLPGSSFVRPKGITGWTKYYRIVAEYGANITTITGPPTGYVVSQSFGDNSTYDLPVNETATAPINPWLAFSNNFTGRYDHADPVAFGAAGDGSTDDLYALQQCLKTYECCNLRSNTTYAIGGTLTLAPNDVLIGQGPYSIIKLKDNATGCTSTTYFSVIKTSGGIDCDVNNTIIRTLTVDCNFENQNRWATTQAIELYGQNNMVDGVKTTHFCVGTGDPNRYYEGFVIATRPARIPTNRVTSGNIIGNCYITDIADQSDYNYTGIVMMTLISCGGNTTPGTMIWQSGAVLVNNFATGMSCNSGSNQCLINCLTVGGVSGAHIYDNRVINVGGTAIYQDTFHTQYANIHNNHFENVIKGIYYWCWPASWYSYYNDFNIWNNYIELAGNELNYYSIYDQQVGIGFARDSDFTGMHITGNHITGKIYTGCGEVTKTGLGFYAWFINGRYTGMLVSGNTLETFNHNNFESQYGLNYYSKYQIKWINNYCVGGVGGKAGLKVIKDGALLYTIYVN